MLSPTLEPNEIKVEYDSISIISEVKTQNIASIKCDMFFYEPDFTAERNRA